MLSNALDNDSAFWAAAALISSPVLLDGELGYAELFLQLQVGLEQRLGVRIRN